MNNVEQLFSWPLLQSLMSFSVIFSRGLSTIEHGGKIEIKNESKSKYLFFDNFPIEMLEPLRRLVVSTFSLFFPFLYLTHF
jgi:hypothetical protein